MEFMDMRRRLSGTGRPARTFAAVLAWVCVVAVGPWVPARAGVADLTGVTVLLGMLLGGAVPSLLLGLFLGRARAWETLGACVAAGVFLWAVDFTVFGDPDVHAAPGAAVALTVPPALVLVVAPLAAGALVSGRYCPHSLPSRR
ncbi:hypothetical protein [Streptomyces sp. VRA16 Mangrove soil]|uniref:hypothetical protein n=1 Tax=Streptomyces sp. VRA16 Mangrove soil TaxID=2817434 RepID=UPI001A9EE36E|nr:hypothetical protein [Streptomyces sp. VRA16 Mangrove soil]MBO1332800.1 hypothetical protein [Streptomyces sp. VRA16 Mangrove soil]